MLLKDSQTYHNLARAYAGECMARTRYEFVEYGARMEGYPELALIIDKIAYNEFNHARLLYTKIQDAEEKEIKNIEISAGFPFKEKWNLVDNLRLASEDEAGEVQIYNKFSEVAKKEGFKEIANLFSQLAVIEESHRKVFDHLYRQLKSNSLYKKKVLTKWKCSGCGYEHTSKEAWKKCPVCSAEQGFVMISLTDAFSQDCNCGCNEKVGKEKDCLGKQGGCKQNEQNCGKGKLSEKKK